MLFPAYRPVQVRNTALYPGPFNLTILWFHIMIRNRYKHIAANSTCEGFLTGTLRMALPFEGCVKMAAMLLVALIVGMTGGVRPAGAAQFDPPGLDGFTVHSERDGDGDGDGVNETRIKQYLNQQGDSLVSMTTKGRVWAWSLNTRDSDSGVKNYVIRDSDCDGTFDEVYSLDDDFHVPECVK
jgi:hypothetical protein